jgi:hypothetical protein
LIICERDDLMIEMERRNNEVYECLPPFSILPLFCSDSVTVLSRWVFFGCTTPRTFLRLYPVPHVLPLDLTALCPVHGPSNPKTRVPLFSAKKADIPNSTLFTNAQLDRSTNIKRSLSRLQPLTIRKQTRQRFEDSSSQWHTRGAQIVEQRDLY